MKSPSLFALFPHVGSGFYQKQRAADAERENEQTNESDT
jgi:hypothetical protein